MLTRKIFENLHAVLAGLPRGAQKGSLSRGPRFRIIRFRMQNSSAQTTACGRDDVFFISGRNSNMCRRYDPFLAHHLILVRNSNICGRYDLFLLIT